MGDFIINLLDHSSSTPIENFLNLMIYRSFYPVINRPTRVTPISCTLTDNIFSNRIDEIESTGTCNNHNHIWPLPNILHGDKTITCNVLSINYRVF